MEGIIRIFELARMSLEENHQRLMENPLLSDEALELCSHETRKTTSGVYSYSIELCRFFPFLSIYLTLFRSIFFGVS